MTKESRPFPMVGKRQKGSEKRGMVKEGRRKLTDKTFYNQ